MGIKKNMFSNFLLSTSTFIFPLITFPYITRTLSNESLGAVLYIDAFTQYFIIFSALGIPLYGVREVSKVKNNSEARSKLVAELLIIKTLLTIALVLLFLSLFYFISGFKTNTALVKLACLSLISSTFLMEWFYQGIENYTFITKRTLIIKSLSVIAIILLVKKFDDKVIYYAILVSVNCFNALINFGYYLLKHHRKFEKKLEIKKHLKPLVTIFLISVAVSVYTVLDTIILGTLTDLKQVSYYSVPLKLSKIVWTLVIGIGFVLIPKISNLFKQGMFDEVRAIMTKSFSIVFLITIPFCFYSLVFSKDLLILISGNKYIEATNALKIFSFLPLIVGICNILGTQFLLPIGKENKILHATLVGLALSLILNFSLIPYFRFMGAAMACLIAELSVCFYVYMIVKNEIVISIDKKLLFHILLSLSITLTFICLIKNSIPNLYCILSSLLIYVLSFITLQIAYFRNTFITLIFNSIYSIIKKNK